MKELGPPAPLVCAGGSPSRWWVIRVLPEDIRKHTRRSEAPGHRGHWKVSWLASPRYKRLQSGHFLYSERRGFPLWPPDPILKSSVTDRMYPRYYEPQIFLDCVFPFLCRGKNPANSKSYFFIFYFFLAVESFTALVG